MIRTGYRFNSGWPDCNDIYAKRLTGLVFNDFVFTEMLISFLPMGLPCHRLTLDYQVTIVWEASLLVVLGNETHGSFSCYAL